jgi:methionyl-tRNA formyltransferase
MRIVFMGTPEFAVKSLESIIKEGYEVVGVITAPDKPAGRGQQLQQSAVKQFALKHHLRVMQPEKLKDPIFVEELRALKTDLQIVVAFRMLPEVVWNMPKLGTFNLHASLLPKYRGAAPINWAVMNGDKESGITTFKLQHEIDTGHVLYRSKVSITDTMTAGELHDILMLQGAELMVKTVEALKDYLDNNTPLNFLPQNDGEATHAPKIFKETCKIEWQQNVWKIYNQIRGLSPYPGAFTEFKNEKGESVSLKIFKAEYKIYTVKRPSTTR